MWDMRRTRTGSCLIVVRKMMSYAVIVAVLLREKEYNVELRRQDAVPMISDARYLTL